MTWDGSESLTQCDNGTVQFSNCSALAHSFVLRAIYGDTRRFVAPAWLAPRPDRTASSYELNMFRLTILRRHDSVHNAPTPTRQKQCPIHSACQTRQDSVSVSCQAVWIESRQSDKVWTVSREIADIAWSLLFSHMQQFTACLHLRGIYNVAAWPASRRRRSTGRRDGLVMSGVAVWTDRRTSAFCVGVRPAVALRRPTHSDTDQTQNALVWLSGRLSSHRHTRHDTTVQSLSCLAWWCELALSRQLRCVDVVCIN